VRQVDACIAELKQIWEAVFPAESAEAAAHEGWLKKIQSTMSIGRLMIEERLVRQPTKRVLDFGEALMKVADKFQVKINAAIGQDPLDKLGLVDLVTQSDVANSVFDHWVKWKKALELLRKIEGKAPVPEGSYSKAAETTDKMNTTVKQVVANATCLAAALRPLQGGKCRKALIRCARKSWKGKDPAVADLELPAEVEEIVAAASG